MTFEDAFHEQWPTGSKVVPRLIKEMHASDDPYTRGKFVEILGKAGGTEVVSELAKELEHEDQGVRCWAVSSLRQIGSPEAALILKNHLADHPEDDA